MAANVSDDADSQDEIPRTEETRSRISSNDTTPSENPFILNQKSRSHESLFEAPNVIGVFDEKLHKLENRVERHITNLQSVNSTRHHAVMESIQEFQQQMYLKEVQKDSENLRRENDLKTI